MAKELEAVIVSAADDLFRFTFPGMTLKTWNKLFVEYPQNLNITTDSSNDDY